MHLDIKEINDILACPSCKKKLPVTDLKDLYCCDCRQTYKRLKYAWDLIPSFWRNTSKLWSVWDQLQANGVLSYTHDPEHNLGVGDRRDCLDFSRFCEFDGLILDIGCGPQDWPTYFALHTKTTRFVGIDPLVGSIPAKYSQFKALAEFLPFQDHVFNQIVFATSLDHFIDPLPPLREAKRVCCSDGTINIWIGEKSKNTPKPTYSPGWYAKLKKSDESDDFFHLARMNSHNIESITRQLHWRIVKKDSQQIDQYRWNHFYKVAV